MPKNCYYYLTITGYHNTLNIKENRNKYVMSKIVYLDTLPAENGILIYTDGCFHFKTGIKIQNFDGNRGDHRSTSHQL